MAIFIEKFVANRARQSDWECAWEGDGVFAEGVVDTYAANLHGFLGEEGNNCRTDGTTPLGGREQAVTGAYRVEEGLRNTALDGRQSAGDYIASRDENYPGIVFTTLG